MMTFKNKKGDIQSIYVMILVLFIIGVIAIVFVKAFRDATAELKATEDLNESASAMTAIKVAEERSLPLLDYLFLAVFIGMTLGVIISSIYIDVHSAFIVVFILGWIITIVVGAILANAYVEVTDESEIATVATEFTFTEIVMEKLPIIVFVIGIIVMIVLYGKGKSQATEV